MPVDPRIAMSFQMPQIAAPMELAQNALALKGAMQQNALAEAKMAEFQQQQSDRNALRSLFAGGKMPEASDVYAIDPTLGASYEKGRYETGEAKTKADIAYWNQQRDTAARISDQPQWSAWRSSLPIPFQQFVPEQYSPENQRRTLATADDALGKIQFETTKTGIEGIDVSPSSPTFGTTLIRREAPPKTPAVQLNLPAAETEFGKGIGKGAAENLQASFQNARSASRSTSNLERLLPLVNDRNFISGTLGDARLVVAKALGLDGAAETQAFFSQMGTETAEAIRSFGAGTGLSDADREYAAGIAGGSIKLTPEAIKKILFLRQQANRAAIKAYNDDRRTYALNNPNARVDQYYQEVPVPPPPAFNPKGWGLQRDKNGNYAYVSPDGKKYEETE